MDPTFQWQEWQSHTVEKRVGWEISPFWKMPSTAGVVLDTTPLFPGGLATTKIWPTREERSKEVFSTSRPRVFLFWIAPQNKSTRNYPAHPGLTVSDFKAASFISTVAFSAIFSIASCLISIFQMLYQSWMTVGNLIIFFWKVFWKFFRRTRTYSLLLLALALCRKLSAPRRPSDSGSCGQ